MTSIGLTLPLAHGGTGLARTVRTLLARWRHARGLAETRRYLEQMDDHMLKDLGVSRAQAVFEIDSAARWGR